MREKTNGVLIRYFPASIKQKIWDQEYNSAKWDYINFTPHDCTYGILEKYAQQGDILDMGCGPGNTANEISEQAYRSYVGVDISEIALQKAKQRTVETGRQDKNQFERSDIINYAPRGLYDVILFRESLYYVPIHRVKATLQHYALYLKPTGVFIVRNYISEDGTMKKRPRYVLDTVESEFNIVEKAIYPKAATILVFRPKSP